MSDIDIKVTYKDINDAIVAMGDLGDKVVSTALKIKRENDATNKLLKLEKTYLEEATARLLHNKQVAEAAAAAKKKAAQDAIAARKQEAAIEKQLMAEIKQEAAMNARYEKDLATQSLKVQRDRARDYTSFWENHFDELERMQRQEADRQEARERALADQKRFLDDLTRSYNPLIAAAEKYSNEVERIQYALANGRISDGQAANLTNKAAENRDVAMFGSGFDTKSLERDFNRAAAAAKLYEREKQRIIVATQRSILTTDQEAAALNRLEAEYQNFANGVAMAGSRFNQFEVGAGRSANSAAKVGFYAQQAGYQLGDFAVQLQSGANAGVAFSQQAAQLAGLIPGIAGALTTFAVIGVGLVIQHFTRAKEEATDLSNVVNDFDQWTPALRRVGASINTNLTENINRVRTAYGNLLAEVANSALTGAKSAVDNSVANGPTSATPTAIGWIFPNVNQRANNAQSSSMIGAQALYNQVVGNNTYSDFDTFVEDYNEFFERLVDSNMHTQMTIDHFRKIAEQSGIVLRLEEQNVNAQEAAQAIAAHRFRQAQEQAREQSRLNDLYAEQQLAMGLSIQLGQIEAQHTKDSIQYLDEVKRQRLLNYDLELQAEGLDTTRIANLVAMKSQLIDQEQQQERINIQLKNMLDTFQNITGIDLSSVFSDASERARGLLGVLNNIKGVMSTISSTNISTRAIEAQISGMRNGMNPDRAAIEGRVVEATASLDGIRGRGAFGIDFGSIVANAVTGAYRQAEIRKLDAQNELNTLVEAWEEANKPSSGGGSSKKNTDNKDPWNDMVKELRFRESLIGLSERERKIAEEVMAVEKALGDEREKYTDERIQQMALQRVAVEELIEAENERIESIKSTSDALANVFTSAIRQMTDDLFEGGENIKDIFKQMSADIIEQLYQDMIVKDFAKTTSNFISGFFSANGSAFDANGIRMFAAGGVVDSPTKFAYNGGIGMAGEAGPEAILPLKRGAGGKLGVAVEGSSGGGIVVTQHFHIAANGDEAVRQIIRQEAPAIAERTKSAIMNDKMRGRKGL